MNGVEVYDTTGIYGTVIERWRDGNAELVRYDSGEVRFRCVVTTWEGTVVIGALDISQHDLTWPDGHPPTVSPSILVNGHDDNPNKPRLHGFLTNGAWHPCGDDQSVPFPEGW